MFTHGCHRIGDEGAFIKYQAVYKLKATLVIFYVPNFQCHDGCHCFSTGGTLTAAGPQFPVSFVRHFFDRN